MAPSNSPIEQALYLDFDGKEYVYHVVPARIFGIPTGFYIVFPRHLQYVPDVIRRLRFPNTVVYKDVDGSPRLDITLPKLSPPYSPLSRTKLQSFNEMVAVTHAITDIILDDYWEYNSNTRGLAVDPITLDMIHHEIIGSLAWFKPPAEFIFLALWYTKRLNALNPKKIPRVVTPNILIKMVTRTFFTSLRIASRWLADRGPTMFIYWRDLMDMEDCHIHSMETHALHLLQHRLSIPREEWKIWLEDIEEDTSSLPTSVLPQHLRASLQRVLQRIRVADVSKAVTTTRLQSVEEVDMKIMMPHLWMFVVKLTL
ncbi:hypothetical protein VNI00_013975 [Paramarasmius palmivorus]|uniref:Uncharacterized protein n=1 Tax=Paramarasmius palmivorus TaxID=297713 RepID=A0AAW0BUN1_9AGAR